MTLEAIKEVIAEFHGDQTYSDTLPYTYHLEKTLEVAKRFGFKDLEILAACYSHDVIEDTIATAEHLLDRGFPPEVVRIVGLVTDEPGESRKERKAKTYPKIRSDKKAVIVKLCDRIANAESAVATGNYLGMYQREHAEFTKQLRDPADGLENMWKHLDGLLEC